MNGIAEPYRNILRQAKARVALREAVDPDESRRISIMINAKHTPMTREDIAVDFGDDAAEKWENIRIAIAAFQEATG
ncbi:hypothetical protein [Paracoccus sp. (in: a-proteobacteria)]|uniref:hypothetical protein n=1 Tax=Paracoccus sp. TaxID=267 RepID=UPI0028A0E57E|nr:hypothetical protein [Paracoccus sp. (in: a-proteobacteria)]